VELPDPGPKPGGFGPAFRIPGMRPRTAVAAAVVLASLAGLVALALVGPGGADGTTVSERWVSDTDRPTGGNHHRVAVARVDGQATAIAPISGRQGSEDCAFVALSAADGSQQWEYSIAPENCTIHSVGDPVVADRDGDGDREVIAATTEESVVALSGTDGEVEFRHELTAYGYSRPVVADLTDDPGRELVVTDVRGTVAVVRSNGSEAWRREFGNLTWGDPAVGDFDADGDPELVVGPGTDGVYLLEADGSTAWHADGLEGSITWLATGQVDDDPAIEVVAATGRGEVVAVDGATGDLEWRRSFDRFAAVEAIGDGDDDGDSEVYAVARDGKLRALSGTDGSTEWTTSLTTEDVQMTPPPSMGDVDGDGDPELVAPGNDGVVSIVDPETGDVLATYEREVAVYAPVTLADANADGVLEAYVLYADGRVVSLSVGGEWRSSGRSLRSVATLRSNGDRSRRTTVLIFSSIQ